MAVPSSTEGFPATVGDEGADVAPAISFSAAGSEDVSQAVFLASPAPRIRGRLPTYHRLVRAPP
eukprot:664269-Alexandrium_andersonii.AAC.1